MNCIDELLIGITSSTSSCVVQSIQHGINDSMWFAMLWWCRFGMCPFIVLYFLVSWNVVFMWAIKSVTWIRGTHTICDYFVATAWITHLLIDILHFDDLRVVISLFFYSQIQQHDWYLACTDPPYTVSLISCVDWGMVQQYAHVVSAPPYVQDCKTILLVSVPNRLLNWGCFLLMIYHFWS